MSDIRTGSAPNFCPPTEEGIVLSFEDETGQVIDLEFLGLVIDDNDNYGFFFPLEDGTNPLDSGEVIVLRVLDQDEDGQPIEFELLEDEDAAMRAYSVFCEATKDLYRFE